MKRILFVFVLLFSFYFISCKKDNNPLTPVTPADRPVVKLISPTSATEVIDSVIVEIEATDDKGIILVEFIVDNIVMKNFTAPPYKFMWDVRNLLDSSTHSVYAKAYDSDNNVTISPAMVVNVNQMKAPTNLVYQFLVDTLLVLQWKDNSKIEKNFVIEISGNGTIFTSVKEVLANTTTTNIEKIFYSDTTYYFRVIAKRDSHKSNYSDTVNAKFVLNAPTGLISQFISDEQISLTWKDNSPFETGYFIESSADGTSYNLIKEVPANITNTNISKIFYSDTTYYFKIKAKTNYNCSVYSNTLIAKFVLNPPTDLTIESLSQTSIKLVDRQQ